MNIIEMLTAIKESEEATSLFSDIIIDLFKEDELFRTAVTEFIKNDVGFELTTEETSDWYYSGVRISLSIDGTRVTSDSMSIRKHD